MKGSATFRGPAHSGDGSTGVCDHTEKSLVMMNILLCYICSGMQQNLLGINENICSPPHSPGGPSGLLLTAV